MKFEKSKKSIKNEKSKTPRTIKDIEDTLKEMDKIHNTSFYDWIKDENNASVIAFKTKDLFQEHYEKQPELVYNALRFLCKDWKLSKIAELILKLFYKCNVASQKLAIIIYEVSLLLENPEKVDLISLLLIGEEAKNVAYFLYHFFQYTEKKYREHTEIPNEEEFLDEMNAFCSGILECLYSCLKWNNDYFKELIIEYINLSTLEIDARREFLIRMVNVKYSRFQQEIQSKKSIQSKEIKISTLDDTFKNTVNEKMNDTNEIFIKSLNFGILVFNMYQAAMRTDVDDLLSVSTPKNEIVNDDLSMDNYDDDILSDTSMNVNSKRIMLKRDDDDGCITLSNTENDLSNISIIKGNEGHMKKEESSATLWMDDNENCNDNFENSEASISKDISSVYNFGCESSYCKNNTGCCSNDNDNSVEESISDSLDEFTYHFEELFNESFSICENDNNENIDEQSLLDDFINKSFTNSNSNSRRNSTLSFASFINDYSMEENGNKINNINNDGSSSRRNSRYSLNLSIQSLPCIENEDRISNSHTSRCNCSCNCRYNNYSDNLLNVFPSPPNSPAITSAPQSPVFLLNDHEFDCNTEKIENGTNDMEDINNRSFLNLNDNTTCNNDTYSSSNNLYRPFSPEIRSPSPIVQSLSVDNVFLNTYGYSFTFTHINSTPTISSPLLSHSTNRDDN